MTIGNVGKSMMMTQLAAAHAAAEAPAPSTPWPSSALLADVAGKQPSDAGTAGLVEALNLPAGYKAERMSDLPDVKPDDQAVASVRTGLEANVAAMTTLNAAADAGMSDAREMTADGTDKAAFLAAHPDVAQRYANDPAFHEGFDAYSWAAQSSPSDKAKIDSRLDAHKQAFLAQMEAVRGLLHGMRG